MGDAPPVDVGTEVEGQRMGSTGDRRTHSPFTANHFSWSHECTKNALLYSCDNMPESAGQGLSDR
jgi:hypothetical protein